MSLTGALACSVILVWSGAQHAFGLRAHEAVLLSHGVLPPRITWLVIRSLVLVELGLGIGVAAPVLMTPSGWSAPAALLLLVQAAVFILFAGYLLAVKSSPRSSRASCGCGGPDAPVSSATVLRASV